MEEGAWVIIQARNEGARKISHFVFSGFNELLIDEWLTVVMSFGAIVGRRWIHRVRG